MPYSPSIMRSYVLFRALSACLLGLVGTGAALPVARAQTAPGPATATPSTMSTPPGAPLAGAAAALPGTTGELSVRVGDEQGTIYIDGREVAQGSYRGTVSAGRHQLRVTRPGYEPFETWVEVEAGQVRAETVSLRQSVVDVTATAATTVLGRSLDGLYGGVHLFGAFQPSGAGTTFEDACDTTGATSCSPQAPLGAGLSGYIGWLFEPLGLELALMGSAQVEEPSATFDGVHGSDINPLVATPARTEKFTIGRFGGGAAIRGRLWYNLPLVRFTFAAGPGLVYRSIAFERETSTPDGFSSDNAESGIDYLSPMLSLEAGASVMLGRSLGLSIGVLSWFETASDSAKSKARNDTVLFKDEKTRPLNQATPSYDLANGPQWFLGPYVGLSFGP
jgi:hypothetical protein